MDNRVYWNFLVGIVIYYLLIFIPIFCGIIHFFAITIGLGAIIKTRLDTYKLARKKGVL